jgi:hypothetical protein
MTALRYSALEWREGISVDMMVDSYGSFGVWL